MKQQSISIIYGDQDWKQDQDQDQQQEQNWQQQQEQQEKLSGKSTNDLEDPGILDDLGRKMCEEGKSSNTVSKYLLDVRQFLEFCRCSQIKGPDSAEEPWRNRQLLLNWREQLGTKYLASSANSKISAVNYFLKSRGAPELCLRYFQVQHARFRAEERELKREDYLSLMRQAQRQKDQNLYMVMETLATTGIRISELRYITVEAVQKQSVVIYNKGKIRNVLLPMKLCSHLQQYIQQKQIPAGSIFITRTGKPMDRSNIYHQMKRLCKNAGVNADKVYPHNFRHLFAVTWYESQKDIIHLADILGHSNLNTTRIYTSMSGAEYRRKIEALDLFMEEELTENS